MRRDTYSSNKGTEQRFDGPDPVSYLREIAYGLRREPMIAV